MLATPGWTNVAMERSALSLFETTARHQPKASAIVSHRETVTYSQLLTAVRSLASILRASGVRRGDKVPVISSRCVEAVVAFLATLWVGACYVPMDTESWSRERIEETTDTISPSCIINTGTDLSGTYMVISKKHIRSCLARSEETPLESQVPDDRDGLAYIIFTSGTTAKPKGVMISNYSLSHYVRQNQEAAPFNLGVRTGDVILLILSVAFDAFTCIVFCSLCNGGALYLSEVATFIDDARQCTILPITPSLLELLPDASGFDHVRAIFLGGESPQPRLIQKWHTHHRRIFNGYGATETTCTSLMAELLPGRPITLGSPMSGSQAMILDDEMQLSEEGQIAITGPGLAEGYYLNDAATNAKFRQREGERIYLTGDFARHTADGLVFLGRRDSMVKNRNFLINLESQVIPMLRTYPGVNDATAFIHRGTLVAFVTPASIVAASLLDDLRRSNDSFLVPDRARSMDLLPLTANGKIDNASLKVALDNEINATKNLGYGEKLQVLMEALSQSLVIPIKDIEPDASFWDLGGNSLSAIKLLSELSSRGWTIALRQIYDTSRLDFLSEQLTPLHRVQFHSDGQMIPTTQQVQMIRSSLKQHTTSNIVVTMRMSGGTVPLSALESALREVFSRHSIFEYDFDLRGDPLLKRRERSLDWQILETRENSQEATRKLLETMLDSTKDCDQDVFQPKNAFRVIKASDAQVDIIWLVHHSLIDGWSIGVLFEEVESVLRGLPPLPTPQFETFLQERQQLIQKMRPASEKFWNEFLDHRVAPERLFATDRPPQAFDPVFKEQHASLRVTHEQLDKHCRAINVTSASLLYAAWGILVSEYTSSDKAIFGVVLSGRTFPMAGVERLVGPLINTCPFLMDIPAQGSLTSFLRKVQDQLLSTTEYQWTAAEMTQTCGPLYNNIVAIEFDLPGAIHEGKLNGSSINVSRQDHPEFELSTYFEKEGDTLLVRFVYDSRIYEEKKIDRMLKHLSNIFHAALVADEVATLRESMISGLEQDSLLNAESSLVSDALPAHPDNLKAAFERAVQNWPDETALESPEGSWSYAALNEASNMVAMSIQQKAQAGDVVSVMSDRSAHWIIATLAVIKAGSIYAPIDMQLPKQRVEYMLKTSRSVFCILPNAQCRERFSEIDFPVLSMQECLESCTYDGAPKTRHCDFAYIVFTSGSTGRPKPVRITHEAVLSYLANPVARLNAAPGRKHAQMFSVGFDVSIAEVFGTLCYGATLLLKGDDSVSHLARAHAAMATPSFLAAIQPEDYPDLDVVLLAGERIPQNLANRWASHCRLYNGYGPCECTIICLLGEVLPGKKVTLGQSVPRTRIYILNSYGRPVPMGVIGEICVSGVQVADGYLDSNEPGNARFLRDPFLPGSRVYRTGDLGSWSEDMEVEFLGRKDNQVKVRGFRIELEEVEHAIMAVGLGIHSAAAVVHNQNIIGVVSPASTQSDLLMEKLASTLPYYMMPSRIFAVDQLPSNANQKLDRAAIQELVTKLSNTESSSTDDAPTTSMQRLLCAAWKEVLNLPESVELGTSDDFMVKGGNSLRQIQLAREVSETLNQRVPLRIFIRNTILSDLAEALEAYQTRERNGMYPSFKTIQTPLQGTQLSTLEEEVLELHHQAEIPSTLNLVVKLELIGKLDLNKLKVAVSDVFIRYDLFRTLYHRTGPQTWREVVPITSQTLHLRCMTAEEAEREIQSPFCLSEQFPLQIFFAGDSHRSLLFLKFHHVVVDKKSVQMLLRELSVQYACSKSESSPGIPDPAQYADWAQWERTQRPPPRMADREYWHEALKALPPLPFRRAGKHAPQAVAHTEVTLRHHSIPFEKYLMAIACAISELRGLKDLIIAVSHMDRSEPGTSNLVGLFLDRLPIRIRLEENGSSAQATATEIRKSLDDALSHAAPYHWIADIAGTDQIFDVMVTYHQHHDALKHNLHIPGVVVQEHLVRSSGARFPLLLEIVESEEGVTCHVEYSRELIPSAEMSELMLRFVDKLASSVNDSL